MRKSLYPTKIALRDLLLRPASSRFRTRTEGKSTERRTFFRSLALATGALASLFVGSLARASSDRAAEPPLLLEREGYFYVGGHEVTLHAGTLVADAMFVQYQVPGKLKHRFPLVFIGGGCASGSLSWLGTPGDREGWAEYFVRRGYSTYIIDRPACGRSAYYPEVDGPIGVGSVERLEKFVYNPDRYRLWPQARLFTQGPGNGKEASDAVFRQYLSQPMAGTANGRQADETTQSALAALLDKVGPAVLVAVSHGGQFAWLTADARPRLVMAIVALEPAGPPFRDDPLVATSKPSNDASSRAWGLADAPLTYDPPVITPSELRFVDEPAAAPDLVPCRYIDGPPRTLPNLAGKPILILTTEASHHARYDYCTSRFLSKMGVANDHLRLEDIGIHGNTHGMLWEKNSLQIAAVVDAWLKKHVAK
ncbi:alpha/beta fold hydrolase [Bradyrhizobium sp. CB82]|uniref:alpha/beta fold hydrolase n=1 Tax=Bradyrhizobium sp. CB82 TaxID=3039159 RepID=UPI0024B22D42|nr:alpha/beta fold hydrolase [Bradyrhizobium sp. CB82]WFU40208.1 alpha/beta fold hydrolase [Bradyrhizobium sp. CB82]